MSTASVTKPLDENYFKNSHTRTNWAVHDKALPEDEKNAGQKTFNDKIPTWPRSVAGVKSLTDQLIQIRDSSVVVAGDAEAVYHTVLKDMAEQGYDVKPYLRKMGAAAPGAITRQEVLAGELVIKDGKLRPVVDKENFKKQVAALLVNVNRLEILKAVAKSASEQDFWGLVTEMLQEEESYPLVGLLAARLLLPQDVRNSLDVKLASVTVLVNRQGKLSIGVVRMGGFLGLACAQGEPDLAQAVKFIKNPILGGDVDIRPLVKRPAETAEQFNARKTTHETQFANYKAIMTEMKRYKPMFEAMDKSVKDKIKAEVLKFTVSG